MKPKLTTEEEDYIVYVMEKYEYNTIVSRDRPINIKKNI